MKLNNWTVGLAAVGAISLSSAVQAEEQSMVETAVSGTTLSGYVSTSFRYNMNTANSGIGGADALGSFKGNGFNLDVVNLTIEKPLDETEWAAGYKAEFLFGPDAAGIGTSGVSLINSLAGTSLYAGSDFAIKQAYVNVRTPVGNGIEWKMGVFDTILGYESFNYNENPNYTRSLGWGIEPTQHTGLLASYQVNDIVSVAAGVAETAGATINDRPWYHPTIAATPSGNFTKDQFNLAYMGAIAVTAPEDMGALAGSTLYGGVLYGRNSMTAADAGNQTSWYAGAAMATPVEGLSVGAAFDYVDYQDTYGLGAASGSTWVAGLYASFQATEKLSLHARGEYQRGNSGFSGAPAGTTEPKGEHWEGTVTAQYDLWENVLARLEFRWDNMNYGPNYGDSGGGTAGGGAIPVSSPTLNNAYMIALNMVYSF